MSPRMILGAGGSPVNPDGSSTVSVIGALAPTVAGILLECCSTRGCADSVVICGKFLASVPCQALMQSLKKHAHLGLSRTEQCFQRACPGEGGKRDCPAS